MLHQTDQMDGGDGVGHESSATDTAVQIYKDFHNLCSRLKQLGEEAFIVCSGSQATMGTSVGTAFVSQEPDLVERFRHFCQGEKVAPNPSRTMTPIAIGTSVRSTFEPYVSQVENNDMEDLDVVLEEVKEVEEFDDDDDDDYVDDGGDDDIYNNDDDYIPEKEITRKSSRTREVKQQEFKKMRMSESSTPTDENAGIITRHKRALQRNQNKEANRDADIKNENRSKSNDKVEANKWFDTKDSEDRISKATQVEGKGHGLDGKVLKLGDVDVVTPDEANVSANASQKDILNCFKCSKECHGIGRLREHLTKVHKTKIGFTCKCGSFFLNKQTFERHTTNSLHFECEHCQEVFFTGSLLKTHLQDKHQIPVDTETTESRNEYVCKKCNSEFEFEHFLEMHRTKLPDCEKILSKESKDKKEIFNEEITFSDIDGEVTKLMSELVAAQTKIPFKCVICKVSYQRKSNFTRHMMTHVSGCVNTCTICGLKFRGYDSMTRHRKEHLQKPYNCVNCRARFATEEELAMHMKQACRGENMENLMCDVCDYTASSRSALQKHKGKHTGVRPYTCRLCGKSVATSASLERHIMAMHEENRPFQCEYCDKTFKTKDTFRKHLKTHSEPRYHCELCGKGCVELGNLKKHMMIHTKEKPYVCEICGKAYGRKSLMENHRRLHTGEKPYQCTVEGCKKCFRSYSNLKQHIRSHSATNPYVCDICGRQFKQPGRLNHHRKDHLIDYRWPCAYCPTKYKSLFMYKNHLAKCHPERKKEIEETTNIRLYQCSLCPKMYGDKEDLTRHIYIHTGQKPFKCQYCTKAFNDKSNLKQHEKIHTGDRKYVCSVCNKAFIHNKTLRLHMKTCHNKVSKTAHAGSAGKEAQVIEPAVVTEMSFAASMENPLMRLSNIQRVTIEERADMLENKAAMESILKPGLRSDSAASSVTMLQPVPSRFISVEPVAGLLEPLMIIENF